MLLREESYLNANDHLLNLIDECDNIEDFWQSCGNFLNQEIKTNNISIVQCQELERNQISEQIDYWHYLINRENDHNYLVNLKNLLKANHHILSQGISVNYHSKENHFSKKLKYCLNQLGIQQIDIFPLLFKQKLLGYLIIEHSDLTEKLIPEEYFYICNLVAKNLAIFIYQNTLTEKIKIIKQKEEKLNREKEKQSKYLSHMNHELRTPIGAVIGFAKMLKQQIYGNLNYKQLQYVEAIYDSGNYLLSLVNDLLDIAKIEAQKEKLCLSKTEVRELCESCISLVKTKAKEQGLQLNLFINSHVNICLLDQNKVKQILVNLLSNAVKFTEVGSVTLQVDNDDKYINFCVQDTGIGIKLSHQDKLFKPFSQLNTHLHQKNKGTGLGLVIARELAKIHQGDIHLTSVENEGSCFTLSLPLDMDTRVKMTCEDNY